MTKEEWTDEFSENLIEIIRDYGSTAEDFSTDLGLASSTVSYWISKKKIPSIYSLIKISYLIDCTMDELCYFGEGITD